MPAAGKGTFRELLEEELDRHGISHRSHSLSDELRQEARFRGLPVDREVLRRLGHELRLKHASDVLSDRVLKRIAFDLRQGLHPEVFVIDAIRNPAEVRRLRKNLDDAFLLIAVVAPHETIVARMQARAREGDVVHTDALARQLLDAELGLNEPEHGHNIAECIAMADVVVDNGGSLPELRQRVQEIVAARVGARS